MKDSHDDGALAQDLLSVQKQFKAWRKRRKFGARIPEVLWRDAARVASSLGTSRTAKALSLDYSMLRRRAGMTQGDPTRSGRTARVASDSAMGGFVDLGVGPWSAGATCVIELDHTGGPRMQVTLKGASCEEFGVVAQRLWSTSR